MDRKALIAVVVCGILMILYYPFILPLFSKKAPPVEVVTEEALHGKQEEGKAETALKAKPLSITPEIPSQTNIPPQEVTIENELVRMVWTNDGAAIKSIQLKNFKNAEAKNTLELIKEINTEYLPLAIDNIFQRKDFRKHRYSVAEQGTNKIVFTTRLEEGVNIVKTVNLPPAQYHAEIEVAMENTTDAEIPLTYDIIASSMITHEGALNADIAAVVGVDMGNKRTKLVRILSKELPSKNESAGIVWTGSVNKYFATVLKPQSSEWVASINSQAFDAMGQPSNEKSDLGNFMVSLQTKLRLNPHDIVKHNYIYFVGPKKEEILAQYENLHALLSYGWLNSISKVLLAFLNAVHRVIPNYGVSIIIMTIIIKAFLFPLTRKSQVSMYRMQQLQPMINLMKEKYKHDKQRMGKEQMLLFKKYGVNPMSGCLPMFLQLPVFIALFRTLQLSFEMRQAPFLLWINDLSMPDTLLSFPFHIPFIGNTLNVLPLIMTAASFGQMKTTPKTPAVDPQAQAQQKMMSFMPVIFAFILYHMPSGLTVYWTTSTLLSIIEGILIRKSIKKIKIK
ncbi:MAG: membrane protein insertase YidC [Candidatus Brocadiaceae bacterium]